MSCRLLTIGRWTNQFLVVFHQESINNQSSQSLDQLNTLDLVVSVILSDCPTSEKKLN